VLDRLAGARIPDPGGLDAGGVVGRGGDDALALGVERRGQDTSCVLQRLTDRRAGARIPDVGGVVVRGGDDALAREVERRGPDLGS
jgi:hypothetical protein